MANSALSLHGPIGVQDNRNELINGDFNIWQRGVTIDIRETVNGYGLIGITEDAGAHNWGYNTFVADRWKIHLNANTVGVTAPAMTISRNKMPLGFPSGADRASKWYLNIWVGMTAGEESSANPSTTAPWGMGGFTGPGHTSDGSFAALVQDIDDVQTLEGKTCILSFWAKSDITNQRVAPVLKQCYAGGTNDTLLIKGSTGHLGHTLDNTWRQYKTSFNVPSVEGQPAVGTSGDDALQVQLVLHSNGVHGATMELGGPLGKTGNISFSQVQLEQGSRSTEFDKENPVTEIFECGRFYQKTYNLDDAPGTDTNTAGMHALNYWIGGVDAISHHEFVPPMKSTPTVSVYDRAGNINKTSNGGGGNNVPVSKIHISERGFNWGFDADSTRPGTSVYYVHIVADSELSVTTNS